MNSLLCLALLLVACGDKDDTGDDAQTATDGGTTADGGTDTDGGTEVEEDPHPVGTPMPAFALEDINPSSPSYGQLVSSQDLAGSPYALIFLDSRCVACDDVADALFAEYQAHPAWAEAMPTFAVESYGALESNPESVESVVDDNDLPYLADTEETWLWLACDALNHDFFAVSAEGTLDAWLPLYVWPDDLVVFQDYMGERFGQ